MNANPVDLAETLGTSGVPVLEFKRTAKREGKRGDAVGNAVNEGAPERGDDRHRIATLRNYRSLMPLAHDARKPMFDLKAADGARGTTQKYVQTCYREFRGLAEGVLARTEGLARP
ncbi:hypothetical protein AB0C40_17405 [Streptomyces brevispora]|uniref:hypothetical protein n=1 Tax=Streptomyces brevispora TaxID=887462 RepID=UPI0033C9B07A